MTDAQALYGAIAVISACVVFIVRAVLAAKKPELVGEFDKYKAYALIAAKFVEDKIDDNYGTEDEASKVASSLHKLDMYLKKFTEIVKAEENALPSDKLIDMAKGWSVELSDRASK